MDIKPGSTVTVEITRTPTTDAAQKTLQRLCRKDPAQLRRQRHQDRHRPSWESWRRGGRQWHHQMKSRPGVKIAAGARYTLLASVDVLRDIKSVDRFVKVTPS